MLSFNLRIAPFFKGRIIWFGHKPNIWSCLFTVYKQSTYCKDSIGYTRQPFYTKIIDLEQPEEVLLKGFKKNTTYEIVRAQREAYHTHVEADKDVFLAFYNRFAQVKKLASVTTNKLERYGAALVITKVVKDDADLAMHAYVADPGSRRVRLLYSASLIQTQTGTDERSAIGRANRLLHFHDMIHFKKLGFSEYDLGGYALNTDDPGLAGINHFKDGFNGELREESDFLPLPVSFLSRLAR